MRSGAEGAGAGAKAQGISQGQRLASARNHAIAEAMAILDHIGVNVSDYARSKAFYEKALAPLGISVLMEFEKACGFGRSRKPEFWIGQGAGASRSPSTSSPSHPCTSASPREAATRWMPSTRRPSGGRDFGAPGVRSEYHPNYYGAFVLDPDGHNVEAVIHTV